MFGIRRSNARQPLLVALIFCAPLLITFVPANPQPAPESIAARVVAEVQIRMPEWIKKKDTPGVAVAVVDDKTVLWSEVYG